MSCPNFMSMKYDMPMICSPTYYQLKDIFDRFYAEDGEEYDIAQYECDLNLYACQAELLAADMNKTLRFHNVTIESGHYDGFQFFVSEKHEDRFDLDAKSKYCIDNDDAKYYFDMCRSEALQRSASEKRRITRWLKSLVEYDFNIVECVDIFSNGEAIYNIAS